LLEDVGIERRVLREEPADEREFDLVDGARERFGLFYVHAQPADGIGHADRDKMREPLHDRHHFVVLLRRRDRADRAFADKDPCQGVPHCTGLAGRAHHDGLAPDRRYRRPEHRVEPDHCGLRPEHGSDRPCLERGKIAEQLVLMHERRNFADDPDRIPDGDRDDDEVAGPRKLFVRECGRAARDEHFAAGPLKDRGKKPAHPAGSTDDACLHVHFSRIVSLTGMPKCLPPSSEHPRILSPAARFTTEIALPSGATSRIVSAFWRIRLAFAPPPSASIRSSGRRSIFVRPTIADRAVPRLSATSTCPPMERSERYAVFPSGSRMYACTAPAFTRNGRGATYGFSSVSACTRSMADEVFPISMPSPSASIEQVSTQTRSPMPTGWIFVTVNGTRCTLPEAFLMSAATAFTIAGSAVLRRIPYTPFSRTWRASSASWTFFTAATIRSDCATRFSSGMTVQSLVVTMTIRFFPFCAASFSLALSVIVHSITSLPGMRSPSGATVVIRPSLLTSPARSATTASAPLSMAVVTISLFHGRASTQNCFIYCFSSAFFGSTLWWTTRQMDWTNARVLS